MLCPCDVAAELRSAIGRGSGFAEACELDEVDGEGVAAGDVVVDLDDAKHGVEAGISGSSYEIAELRDRNRRPQGAVAIAGAELSAEEARPVGEQPSAERHHVARLHLDVERRAVPKSDVDADVEDDAFVVDVVQADADAGIEPLDRGDGLGRTKHRGEQTEEGFVGVVVTREEELEDDVERGIEERLHTCSSVCARVGCGTVGTIGRRRRLPGFLPSA
jgi:hypothetical protein